MGALHARHGVRTENLVSDTRTMRNWGARLGAPDEQLTLEEARTLAQIAAVDRLLECLTALTDTQMRVKRMERFISAAFPGYDRIVREQLKALDDGEDDES